MKDRKKGKQALLGVLKFLVIPILLIILINWKYGLGVFTLFLIRYIYKIRKRKYFAKDTEGKKVGFKQFMKRWKEGVEGISPIQQSRTTILGNWITLSGILAGIIINALVRVKNQWIWIEVILLGSLVLVVIQMIGGLQKYWRFKEVDKIQKKLEEELKKDLKELDTIKVEEEKELIKENNKLSEPNVCPQVKMEQLK